MFRDPVDRVFDYIVQLLDEATPSSLVIQEAVTEQGRITCASLTLKAKVLVTRQSLFNGNMNTRQ